MKWISVKDQLPEDIDDMCSCPQDYFLVSMQNSSMIGLATRYENKWDILNNEGVDGCTGTNYFDSKDITHWMPLPKPPKDSNEMD